MPVRSLTSPVLAWPDRDSVDRSFRSWTKQAGNDRSDLLLAGYIGSYARGDWGVGSDLDVVLVIEASDLPFEKRGLEWDVSDLPVPTDLLVYTRSEWEALPRETRFARTLRDETVWVFAAPGMPRPDA